MVEIYREAAILLEKFLDLWSAKQVMEFSSILRPDGLFIKDRLNYYAEAINKRLGHLDESLCIFSKKGLLKITSLARIPAK